MPNPTTELTRREWLAQKGLLKPGARAGRFTDQARRELEAAKASGVVFADDKK